MCNSLLEFEGQLKKDNGDFTKGQLITFENNGILFLFDKTKYLLSSAEIESVYNPGTTSNILGLAKYSKDFSPGLIQCWAPDTGDGEPKDGNLGFKARRLFNQTSTTVGKFRFSVPLSHIFGFADDYHRVIYGFNHTLVLTRASSDANALFRKKDTKTVAENVPNGVVNLTNIRWNVQRVKSADVARYKLAKQIQAETILNVGFRMRQCVLIILPAANNFTW